MDKARIALRSARILLDVGDTDGATNRAYYAMFDAALAALNWMGGDAGHVSRHRTHSGLIASFGHQLVQTGRLSADLGRSLNRVQDLRLTADYFAGPVSPDKAKWAIDEAENFISAVGKLLAEASSDTSGRRNASPRSKIS